MPRKSIRNTKQTHGQVVNDYTPNTLNQVWGDTGFSKYRTFDVEEYRDQLRNMSKADLRAHSAKMGIVPIDNRELLTKSLVRQFNAYVASYRKPVAPVKQTPKLSEKAIKILSEGR